MAGWHQYGNWAVCFFVDSLIGGGLRVAATFDNRLVISSANAPFALVPYHGGLASFKDGLGPAGDGRGFTLLVPNAPNVHQEQLPGGSVAANDGKFDPGNNPGGGVCVETHAKGFIEPEHLEIWAKFQCYNYQYIHRYKFYADGKIDMEVGLGGQLNTDAERGHIHHFYFRLDINIEGKGKNQIQTMKHNHIADAGDTWVPILKEKKEIFSGKEHTKWRVVGKTPGPNGKLRSYELIPGGDGAPDGVISSGDMWAVLLKDFEETGFDVGVNDSVLTNSYIVNQENVDGKNVVLWYCLRTHHVTRWQSEEQKVLPYHFTGFHLEPRDFLDGTPLGLYSTIPPSP